ncbi:MAG TPA: 2-oxo acid dehydrogenase subunit E2, partial [Microvirga sp.]|nr:2-oxo acid dehydrogenase subunit E2 [Microvirga sp.]
MPINILMPALSPTMEKGNLAKWLKKEGDTVKSGDVIAEIETDKATMEVEAVDEGILAKIVVPEGTADVPVNELIALIAAEGEDASAAAVSPSPPTGEGKAASAAEGEGAKGEEKAPQAPSPAPPPTQSPAPSPPAAAAAPPSPAKGGGAAERIKASPLARRLAQQQGIDLATLKGSGPNGRIVRADLATGVAAPAAAPSPQVQATTPAAPTAAPGEIPHEVVKLSNMRKTIARRLTESKQQIPHIYLTVDIQLDALLKLRSELNASLESRSVKLSVNDFMIKALAVALLAEPKCNVMFTP